MKSFVGNTVSGHLQKKAGDVWVIVEVFMAAEVEAFNYEQYAKESLVESANGRLCWCVEVWRLWTMRGIRWRCLFVRYVWAQISKWCSVGVRDIVNALGALGKEDEVVKLCDALVMKCGINYYTAWCKKEQRKLSVCLFVWISHPFSLPRNSPFSSVSIYLSLSLGLDLFLCISSLVCLHVCPTVCETCLGILETHVDRISERGLKALFSLFCPALCCP